MQGESRAKAVRFARMYAIVHKNMTYNTSRRGGSMSDMIGVFNAYTTSEKHEAQVPCYIISPSALNHIIMIMIY